MMRLPKFEYHVPRTIAEGVRIMADVGPDGQFVAGGTDLYPNMKRRQQTPRYLSSCSYSFFSLRVNKRALINRIRSPRSAKPTISNLPLLDVPTISNLRSRVE